MLIQPQDSLEMYYPSRFQILEYSKFLENGGNKKCYIFNKPHLEKCNLVVGKDVLLPLNSKNKHVLLWSCQFPWSMDACILYWQLMGCSLGISGSTRKFLFNTRWPKKSILGDQCIVIPKVIYFITWYIIF